MDSDTDSERDRRAFGQYASLATEGDSDIDEEAASYLRSVRDEARALPDVMISGYEAENGTRAAPALDERHSTGEMPCADIQAGSHWIKEFMDDFLQLRLALQRLELTASGTGKESLAHEYLGGSPDVANGREEAIESSMTNPLPTLSFLLALDKEAAANRLEEEVDRISTQESLQAEDVYIIYALSAVLDYPLMASTEASMVQLLRSCSQRRKSSNELQTSFLDILEALGGAYFGQDMQLRSLYREHGLHI